MRLRLFLFFISLFGFRAVALASIDAGFTLGFAAGGDNLAEATGGQNYGINAGEGLFIGGNLIVPISDTTPHRFEAQLGLMHMSGTDAKSKDDEVQWIRYPIEALYFYRNTQEMFRAGWGVTHQILGRINGKRHNSSASTSVENATGWVVAAEKLWEGPIDKDKQGVWSVGIRYVGIRHRLRDFGTEANGSGWSMTFSMFFL